MSVNKLTVPRKKTFFRGHREKENFTCSSSFFSISNGIVLREGGVRQKNYTSKGVSIWIEVKITSYDCKLSSCCAHADQSSFLLTAKPPL